MSLSTNHTTVILTDGVPELECIGSADDRAVAAAVRPGGEAVHTFGDSKIDETAARYGTQVIAKLPIDPELAAAADEGKAESYAGNYFDKAVSYLENTLGK